MITEAEEIKNMVKKSIFYYQVIVIMSSTLVTSQIIMFLQEIR